MDYVFIQPISMVSLFVLFITFLVLLFYLTYIFAKKSRISNLKKTKTAFIVGFPNSGKSFILKELCKRDTGNFDKMLNISYSDFIHDGRSKLKILDHHGLFSLDGKLYDNTIDKLKSIDPKYIIDIVDVSPFTDPIENQINFVTKVNEKFKDKKIFLVANKVDKNSKKKLMKIEEIFGKNFYKVRINKPTDIEPLRKDLLNLLEMN